MTRRQAPLQINKFAGGLNTEFNPLEASPETTSDERNMEVNRDGSRSKRLGILYEENYVEVDTGLAFLANQELGKKFFKWENAGGTSNKTLYVVQIGNVVKVFDPDLSDSISDGEIYTRTFGNNLYTRFMDMTVIDGLLIVVTGNKTVYVYEYDEVTSSITEEGKLLYIRDLFGVEASVDGVTLTDQQNLSKRPPWTNSRHTYNLRNQTFSYPRQIENAETLTDPISGFVNTALNTSKVFPSNSDNINEHFYPDPNDGDNRLVERFFANNMFSNPAGIQEAPKGFFIIDALERGPSRIEQHQKLLADYPQLTNLVTQLPTDTTPGGASVVGQFAGRIWYGGFSGEVTGPDSKSPRMSSYLLFSTLVRDKSDINQCYQRADPTSNEDPDIVSTDGGFLRVDGAYGIKKFVAIDDAMFILAENGVWRITGSEDGAFAATSYQIKKITDKGCISKNSVVQVGNTLFYWGEDAIYYVSQNELGVWSSQDITKENIQTFYSQISTNSKESVTGFFDSFEQKIRWIYSDKPGVATSSYELILNVKFSSFTINEVPVHSSNFPLVVSIGETSPYNLNPTQEIVTVSDVTVTSGGQDVFVNVTQQVSVVKEVIYLVISGTSPTITFSFATFRNEEYYDWGNSVSGVSYPAYLVTNSVTAGEARFKKQAPYLNMFFRKTEDGFDSGLVPTNQSSCMLSSRWNWTNNNNSNKWSTPRQAYRIGRLYFPTGPSDLYDSGDTMIVTRNKIRGVGHSLAFKLEAENGKALHVYGWSFDLQANGKE